MSVARQLHRLQEIDLQLSANERKQADMRAQIGPSQLAARLRRDLAEEQQRLKELRSAQQDAELEAEDLAQRVSIEEGRLFGGKIRNPKELASLQKETDYLKARRTRAEDRALEIMGQAEQAAGKVSSLDARVQQEEADWRERQARLSEDLEQATEAHSDLTGKRQLLAEEIDHEALQVYHQIRDRRGTGVARVEQGTCRGCQITLPTTELQQARGGGLVRCSSCGRILFLA